MHIFLYPYRKVLTPKVHIGGIHDHEFYGTQVQGSSISHIENIPSTKNNHKFNYPWGVTEDF